MPVSKVPKTKKVYVCSECGEESIAWQGKCPVCGVWNSLKEIHIDTTPAKLSPSALPKLEKLDVGKALESVARHQTGIAEFDRVLGGGIVPGSVVLLGGEPGVGKSTLLLQAVQALGSNQAVVYFSGEESLHQVADRAKRLGVAPTFYFQNETRIDYILASISQSKPATVVIDSIQTLYDERFPSTPGSLVQVRECALRLQTLAKSTHTTVILVGHITKEGTLGGPKTLEHMVDVVLYLEGEPRSDTRLLRSVKNRFGATNEVGLFTLEQNGMIPVANPALLFVESDRPTIAGTALTAVIEGIRPILVEVQALVVPTAFGYPKRTSLGVDPQRLSIVLAILEARAGLSLGQHDVFINVVGGYKLHDRSADLGVCMAIASAVSGVALPPKQVFYGEVGLSGEIRQLAKQDRRASEVTRLGFRPSPDAKSLKELIAQFCAKGRAR